MSKRRTVFFATAIVVPPVLVGALMHLGLAHRQGSVLVLAAVMGICWLALLTGAVGRPPAQS